MGVLEGNINNIDLRFSAARPIISSIEHAITNNLGEAHRAWFIFWECMQSLVLSSSCFGEGFGNYLAAACVKRVGRPNDHAMVETRAMGCAVLDNKTSTMQTIARGLANRAVDNGRGCRLHDTERNVTRRKFQDPLSAKVIERASKGKRAGTKFTVGMNLSADDIRCMTVSAEEVAKRSTARKSCASQRVSAAQAHQNQVPNQSVPEAEVAEQSRRRDDYFEFSDDSDDVGNDEIDADIRARGAISTTKKRRLSSGVEQPMKRRKRRHSIPIDDDDDSDDVGDYENGERRTTPPPTPPPPRSGFKSPPAKSRGGASTPPAPLSHADRTSMLTLFATIGQRAPQQPCRPTRHGRGRRMTLQAQQQARK